MPTGSTRYQNTGSTIQFHAAYNNSPRSLPIHRKTRVHNEHCGCEPLVRVDVIGTLWRCVGAVVDAIAVIVLSAKRADARAKRCLYATSYAKPGTDCIGTANAVW
jgi:hypothetical protein